MTIIRELSEEDGLTLLSRLAPAVVEAEEWSARTLARETGQTRQICALLSSMGWVIEKRGDFALAEAYLQEGLALARKTGDREQLCTLLRVLGSVADLRGTFAQAEAYYQEYLRRGPYFLRDDALAAYN